MGEHHGPDVLRYDSVWFKVLLLLEFDHTLLCVLAEDPVDLDRRVLVEDALLLLGVRSLARMFENGVVQKQVQEVLQLNDFLV